MWTKQLLVTGALVTTWPSLGQGHFLGSRDVEEPRSLPSTSNVCSYVAQSPFPLGTTCESFGSLAPTAVGVPVDTQNFDTCVLACGHSAVCNSFGFNTLTKSCTHYTQPLTGLGFTSIPTAPNLFSSSACYTKVCKAVDPPTSFSACRNGTGSGTFTTKTFHLRVAHGTTSAFEGYWLNNEYDVLGINIVGIFEYTTKGAFQLMNGKTGAISQFGPGELSDFPDGETRAVSGSLPGTVPGAPKGAMVFKYRNATSGNVMKCKRTKTRMLCTNTSNKPMKFYVCDLIFQPVQADTSVPAGCHELEFVPYPNCLN